MLRKVQFVKDMARTKCLTVNYSVIITPTNTVRYIDCCMLILFCPFFTKKKRIILLPDSTLIFMTLAGI